MAGITDLEQLLRSMEPAALEDEYVFVSVTADRARELTYAAMVREDEGTSLVMRRPDADAAGLPYDFVAAWITLTVHSDLEAVGLTAAFATALGDRGRRRCLVVPACARPRVGSSDRLSRARYGSPTAA